MPDEQTSDAPTMRVTKRNGTTEAVDVNKIVRAVARCAVGVPDVDPLRVATKTIAALYDGATTQDLDQQSIRTAAALITEEPRYGTLAARMLGVYIAKEVKNQGIHAFSQAVAAAAAVGLIAPRLRDLVAANARKFDDLVDPAFDQGFEYFGLQTVYDRYLLRHPTTRKVLETPQHFLMRIAVAVAASPAEVGELYRLFASLSYLPSSPTLFNAGTKHEQLASCFLLDSPGDDLTSIYRRYGDIAQLSKFAGGIGVGITRVRARGSLIASTNGHSNGIVPWLKILDASVAGVHQGGKRKGACAVYLEPWHADVEEFLELRDNTGDESRRTHNLNLAHWIPDIFMRRVEANAAWSLFDPKTVPHFPDLYGPEFEAAYEAAEAAGLAVKTLPAQDLYAKMLRTLAQTGNGWMTFKDRSNLTCNQTGRPGNVVHLSNLCVAPETLILTEAGDVPIVGLVDQEVRVWNGDEWSLVTVRKTGTMVPLVRVRLTTGLHIDCTPAHRFIMARGERRPASELRPGDELARYTLPARDGGWEATHHQVAVVGVDDLGRVGDTYCFTEPLRHAGVFNGVLTGQCSEIVEVSTEEETAVCNLGSINLAKHVTRDAAGRPALDFDRLATTTALAVRQLDRVIDLSYYGLPGARASNARWRPVGLGKMGLQDVFFMFGLPFDAPAARAISVQLAAAIYYHALRASCDLARQHGPHPAFAETRAAQGFLQFDAWPVPPEQHAAVGAPGAPLAHLDWAGLRADIKRHGLRNSLLVAIAPTATIASITGSYECIEPQVSNLFRRETMSGDFLQINQYLVADLKRLGLWTEATRDRLRRGDGSVQELAELPAELRAVYRTAWEISQQSLIDMAADRGAYVDQSQSLNLFVANPKIGPLSAMYRHAWRQGLKTTYYLRSRAATRVAQTTAAPVVADADAAAVACSLESPAACEACQ